MTIPSPFMPLYGDDFWESEHVIAMDNDAVALYHYLLWRQFKHGDLPADPSGVCQRFLKDWARLWPQVSPCFKRVKGGRLRNQRCHKERSHALKRSQSAKASATQRWGSKKGMRTHSDRNANALPTHCDGNALQDRTEQDRTQQHKGGAPNAPGGVDVEVRRYDAFRQAQGWRPLSPESWAEIRAKFDTVEDLSEAVSTAIERGWKSLYPVKRESGLDDYPEFVNGRPITNHGKPVQR